MTSEGGDKYSPCTVLIDWPPGPCCCSWFYSQHGTLPTQCYEYTRTRKNTAGRESGRLRLSFCVVGDQGISDKARCLKEECRRLCTRPAFIRLSSVSLQLLQRHHSESILTLWHHDSMASMISPQALSKDSYYIVHYMVNINVWLIEVMLLDI